MEQKEVFSKKDNILLLLCLVSILISSVLIFGFKLFPLMLTIIMIIFISTIISLIVKRSFNKDLLIEIKEVTYILTYSILPTLIFATILPYMIFRNNFFSIYTIILAYILPTLLVFFILLHVFDYVIKKKEIRYNHMIIVSLIISVLIVILLLACTAFGTDYLYMEISEEYYDNYNEWLLDPFEHVGDSKLEIINEIEIFQGTILQEAEEQNIEFINYDISKSFCFTNDCVKNVIDKKHSSIMNMIKTIISNGVLKLAKEELEYLNSEQYLENFTSLEEYELYLMNEISSKELQFEVLSEENQELRSLIESDFSYKEFEAKIEYYNKFQSISGLGITETFVFEEDQSMFLESLSHTVKHTTAFKEFIKFVVNISLYFEDKSKLNKLIIQTYENKGMEESLESSVIRNKIQHYYLAKEY